MIFKNMRLPALGICLALLLTCCSKDDVPEVPTIPVTCLTAENQIIISDIRGIPDGVTFDKIKIEISGVAWSIIATVVTNYGDGQAVVELPTGFAEEDLCKVARDDAGDYYGFWPAEGVDNRDARVAGFEDFVVYNGDTPVGRVYLTDSEGDNASDFKNYVYYHYANEPFTLSGFNYTVNGNQRSFQYQASFARGWNAYFRIKGDITLVTTTVPEEISLGWRFESW